MSLFRKISPLILLINCLVVLNGCIKESEISNEKVIRKVTKGDFLITVKTPKEVEVGKKIELEGSIEYTGKKETYIIHESNKKDFYYTITKKQEPKAVMERYYFERGFDQTIKKGDIIAEKEVTKINNKGTYEIMAEVSFASSNKVFNRKKEDLIPINVKIEDIQLIVK